MGTLVQLFQITRIYVFFEIGNQKLLRGKIGISNKEIFSYNIKMAYEKETTSNLTSDPSNIFEFGGAIHPGESKLIGTCHIYPHEQFIQPCIWELSKHFNHKSNNECFCLIF